MTDNKVLEHLTRDWRSRRLLLASQLYKDQEESLSETCAFLRKRVEEKDTGQLLTDEGIMIRHMLKFDSNSPEETQSLNAALVQLDEAMKCLDVVNNDPQGYAAPANPYPGRKKEAGLPLDAVRDFLKSHSARLTNRLAGKGSPSEKLLLRQRKENLNAIKERYIELQKEILGVSQ